MTAAPAHPSRADRRAKTGRGQPSQRPDGAYEPTSLVTETPAGLEVTVIGEDGRQKIFSMKGLPLSPWHRPLADAFAHCAGTHGTLRTPGSAAPVWFAIRVFLNSLDAMADKPTTPHRLTTRHLERYLLDRRGAVRTTTVHKQLRSVHMVLRHVQPPDLVAKEALWWFDRRRATGHHEAPSGYSDREFDAIMVAARSKVVSIRNRLQKGQRLAQLPEKELARLDAPEQALAAALKNIATTGIVPTVLRPDGLADRVAMHELAGHLFLRHCDLGPLLQYVRV